MHEGLSRLGVPREATVLEPGCGIGNFMGQAPAGMRFIGVELDYISGRIAQTLYPHHDIRIESFLDTLLPEGCIDAVIGNVPFADVRLEHRGLRLSLHDFFFAKSIDALKPGGVLALVTSHFTLDKQNAATREYLAERADFLGAIRLPSDAFKREGTRVVTDIVFLPPRRRRTGTPRRPRLARRRAPAYRRRSSTHQPLLPESRRDGTWHVEPKDRLYGSGYSVELTGDLSDELASAIHRLPRGSSRVLEERPVVKISFRPPPPEPYITEGSLSVGEGSRIICQSQGGQAVPVTYGGTLLKADGTMTGRRIAGLIQLRDLARRVLQSQNEGWPDSHRDAARRDLNRVYDLFVGTYGPINKTTFGETREGTVIRRMPNLVKFREDPDAMLVMSLEDYDETTGRAAKPAILLKDVVGEARPSPRCRVPRRDFSFRSTTAASSTCPTSPRSTRSPRRGSSRSSPTSSTTTPIKTWQTADAYLSGNVRAKLAEAQKAGPAYARNAEALSAVQPEDVLPGDIDANLGARGYRNTTSATSPRPFSTFPPRQFASAT